MRDPVKDRENSRKYRAEHPEKMREKARKRYAEHPEKIKEYSRKYRAKHPEKMRERQHKYYAEHREKINEKVRMHSAENREEINEQHRKYRATKRVRVLQAYGNRCVCCGESQVEFLTIDHVNGDGAAHRREIGGGGALYLWLIKNNFPEGFQVLCANCNMSKGAKGKCVHEEEREA